MTFHVELRTRVRKIAWLWYHSLDHEPYREFAENEIHGGFGYRDENILTLIKHIRECVCQHR